jgi:hypothetical protein
MCEILMDTLQKGTTREPAAAATSYMILGISQGNSSTVDPEPKLTVGGNHMIHRLLHQLPQGFLVHVL